MPATTRRKSAPAPQFPKKLYVVAYFTPRTGKWRLYGDPIPLDRAKYVLSLWRNHEDQTGVRVEICPVEVSVDTSKLCNEPSKVLLKPISAVGRKHPDANRTAYRARRSSCDAFASEFNDREAKQKHKLGLKAIVVTKV